MSARSAGLVLYRRVEGAIEILAVHPGGPFWARKDDGAWSIPKGELDDETDELAVARREFAEELGVEAPDGPVLDLGEIRQRGGKRVRAFAVEGELDPSTVISNTVEIEWPPRSGQRLEIPEVDRAEWFAPERAREKLNAAQVPFVDRLLELLAEPEGKV
ncbi:MAG TPA: NUDIX domain-containing protein [Microthrixaceae bacterium]|nr:NUDIX domain-containing protein [Microthrixaceae bacterium]